MNKKVGSARSMSLGTEKSVSEQDFYIHKLGWLVVRCKSKSKRHTICLAARNGCANDNITYSQERRTEIYNNGTNTKKPTKADCSSFGVQCCREAGINMPNSTTANFAHNAVLTGQFEVFDFKSEHELYNGDILVTPIKGHLVVCTRGFRKNSKTSK